MSMKFKNNAGSKLAGILTSDATTITVLTGTGANFPSISSNKDYFHATIVGDNGDMEIVRVTAVSGDTLTVIRAQEGTTAKEWPVDTRIENRITAEFLNQVATGDTIKFDQKTIKTNEEGVSAVDPSEVYGIASKDKLGVVKVDKSTISISDDGTISVANGVEVDDVTIKKNESGVISVKPEGIIDNDTVVLDKNGKISTKSIPFEGGSLLVLQATELQNKFPARYTSLSNGGMNIIPRLAAISINKTLDGRMAYHFDDTDIVFDEEGFFSFSFQWGQMPTEGAKEHDVTYYIAKKNPNSNIYVPVSIESGKLDSVSELLNYTDVRCIINVEVGTRVQTYAHISPAYDTNVPGSAVTRFIGTIFKYPITNEYQINSSELNTYSKSNFTVPNPNSSPNLFDPGDFLTSSNVYTGTTFTEKTEDGFVKVLESGVYVISHYINVVIGSSDTNTYDMPHGVMIIKDGPTYDYVMQSTVTVRNNAITNDADEATGLVYLSAGEVIAPFIYAPTSIYNPIRIESSNLRIVKLASSSQITHNHSAYKTITLTNEDNIDNLKPGSYYCPTGVTPQGTYSTLDADWVLVVFGDGEVVNNSFKQVMYTSHDSIRIKEREYDSGWTTWGGSFSLATTDVNGVLRLATQEQVTAGTEAGAYAVTPALAKTAIETFAPTIVNNTINSSESTLHQTIQNMIDASTPEVTPESFTGILPIAKGGTGNATGHAVSATTWDGATKYVSTAAPSGGVDGDIWFQYI